MRILFYTQGHPIMAMRPFHKVYIFGNYCLIIYRLFVKIEP